VIVCPKPTLKHIFPCEKQVVSNLVQWETFPDFLPIASSVDHLAPYLFFSGSFINPESWEKTRTSNLQCLAKITHMGLSATPQFDG